MNDLQKFTYSVSEWREYGIKRGYWDYFKELIYQEIREKIQDHHHEGKRCECLDQIMKILN